MPTIRYLQDRQMRRNINRQLRSDVKKVNEEVVRCEPEEASNINNSDKNKQENRYINITFHVFEAQGLKEMILDQVRDKKLAKQILASNQEDERERQEQIQILR
ncbi:hypothetical protein RhiirA4_416990 [Rhizophagus irregularis]|uniref:Uncharacterized protein n=1 Tax=Rhizophagus irregularis TaxID=588596 RepID=A0A2I1G5E7_9GLOM|nr:hypothetical protein RhiirA4_416990 [Rhizophagus irregularis]